MTTTYTPLWRLAVLTPGDPATQNSWGAVQDATMPLMEQGAVGQVAVSIAGETTYSLSTANNAADQARYLIQSYTGALTGNCTVTIPNLSRVGWAQNSTTGGYDVILTAGAGTTATIPPDGNLYFYQADGSTNVKLVGVGFADLALSGAFSVGGALTVEDGITITAGGLEVNGALLPAILRSYIGGLTLSNDASTPNSVLDISAGSCSDSADAVTITLGAFTKSTAGIWAGGSGSDGMGTGLTIANNTWYHVFAIINAGAADVYFDTSVTAANAPASTTAFRRIGSFQTDGSARIQPFTQAGDYFLYDRASLPLDIDDTAVNTGARTTAALTVPPGVVVQAMISAQASNPGLSTYIGFSSLAEPDRVMGTTNADLATAATQAGSDNLTAGRFEILTNTSGQIGYRGLAASGSLVLQCGTRGYIDSRGKNA